MKLTESRSKEVKRLGENMFVGNISYCRRTPCPPLTQLCRRTPCPSLTQLSANSLSISDSAENNPSASLASGSSDLYKMISCVSFRFSSLTHDDLQAE